MSAWFPRLRADGRALIGGIENGAPGAGVEWDGRAVVWPGHRLTGSCKAWLDDRMVVTDGYSLGVVPSPGAPVIAVGPVVSNVLTAGGGLTAWWHPGPPEIVVTDGRTVPDGSDPQLDEDGRLAWFGRYHEVRHELRQDGVSGVIWSGSGMSLAARDGWLGWVDTTGQAWLWDGQIVRHVNVVTRQYVAVPVRLPHSADPWVLSCDDRRLLLYRAGDRHGFVVFPRPFDHAQSCDARPLDAEHVRVVWSYDGGTLGDETVRITTDLTHLS